VDSAFFCLFAWQLNKKNEICCERKVYKFFDSKEETIDWELDGKSRNFS